MPDFRNEIRRRLAPLRLTLAAESELVDEVAAHLDDRYRELRSAGIDDEEARHQTLAELADLQPMRARLARKEQMPRTEPVRTGESSPASLLEGIWKDTRYAVRSLGKSPVFVVFVVLTLALGIGANTTVFTLINTLLLNPLPVHNAGQLAAVGGVDAQRGTKSSSLFPLSYLDVKDYQSRNQVFTTLSGFTSARPMTWQNHGASQGIFGELVTANYFSTLGLAPTRGRFFAPEEDSAPGAHPVAVMNYATWQTRFGASDVVGQEIQVNGVALTVIGVAPPHFIGVNAIFGPDLWVPAAMAGQLFPNSLANALTDRGKAAFLAVGRIKPGVTAAQAEANITAIATSLAQYYPDSNAGHSAAVRPIREILLDNSGTGAGSVIFASIALSVVVGIVLLIACSNVANLLLARSAARRQEMAVRLAMGASRTRLIRQLLTESMLLSLVSGAAGVLLAYAGLRFLFGQLPQAANFPVPKLDGLVLAFSLAVSLLTGLLFGAIPAFKASSANVAEGLKEGGRAAGRSRRRVTVANGLLVGQVAFSFLLLVTAALFLRSIGRAYRMDPGFQTAHLAVFPAGPGQAGYNKAQSKAFYRDVRDRVAALPGIASVSWASNMPLWARASSGLEVDGRQARSRTDQIRTVVNTVDRDYFETAGVPIEAGRAFTLADRETSLPVAIINRRLADEYFPGGAIGKRIRVPGETVTRQVVGVARTANYTGLGEPHQACVYVPLEQKYADSMVLYVRTRTDPDGVIGPVTNELHAVGPQVLVFGTRTGDKIIDGGLFQAKMGVGLLAIFGLLALSLASIGLYGVLAYSVNQRRREIGLRMALGATRSTVLALVLREGMSLVIAGVLIGYAGAMATGRLLSGVLYGVGASDPVSFAAAAGALGMVALLACYLPARWATRVDPLHALREP